jgi:4-alpha-glucanotransferase
VTAPDPVEPRLAELATACGVATSYRDWLDRPTAVRRSAVVAALAALDVDAATPAAVEQALLEREDAVWRRLLPHSVVLRGPDRGVALRAPEGADVSLQVLLEDGTQLDVVVPGTVAGARGDRVLRRSSCRGCRWAGTSCGPPPTA